MMEDKFQEVKVYINENPGATIEVVAKKCNVATKQIKQWIREERLTFSPDSTQGIECEQCGTMIRSGRFCNSCKTKLQTDFKNATYKPAPEVKKPTKDKDRMRFL
jgi:methionyl-tRNA synthetase